MDKNSNYSLMDSIEQSMSRRVLSLEPKNASTLVWFILGVSIVLAIAAQASTLLQLPDFINILLNIPSGLLLFAFIYIKFEAQQGKISEYKEKYTLRTRINRMILVWAISLPVAILIGLTPAKALGASIIITLFLLTLSILRRTDIEIEYASNGLIDPRELREGK
jgi:hypothetical protein